MGAITPDKRLYDQATVACFQYRGWQAFAISKTGRYADVLAIKDNSLALIEVKSIKETAAVKKYDDSKNLAVYLEEEIGDYLKEARHKVFGFFKQRGQSIEKLYAVSIACQAYRYFHEFEEQAAEYEQFTDPIRLQGINFTKIPFLVVPEEHAGKLSTALDVLKKNDVLATYEVQRASRLVIAELTYQR